MRNKEMRILSADRPDGSLLTEKLLFHQKIIGNKLKKKKKDKKKVPTLEGI